MPEVKGAVLGMNALDLKLVICKIDVMMYMSEHTCVWLNDETFVSNTHLVSEKIYIAFML